MPVCAKFCVSNMSLSNFIEGEESASLALWSPEFPVPKGLKCQTIGL